MIHRILVAKKQLSYLFLCDSSYITKDNSSSILDVEVHFSLKDSSSKIKDSVLKDVESKCVCSKEDLDFVEKICSCTFSSLIEEMSGLYLENLETESTVFDASLHHKTSLSATRKEADKVQLSEKNESKSDKRVLTESEIDAINEIKKGRVNISSDSFDLFSQNESSNKKSEKDFKSIIDDDDKDKAISDLYYEYNNFKIIYKVAKNIAKYAGSINLTNYMLLKSAVLFYKYQNDVTNISLRMSEQKPKSVPNSTLLKPAYYSRFALAVYGSGMKVQTEHGTKTLMSRNEKEFLDNICEFLEIKKSQVLDFNFKDTFVYKPGYAIIHDLTNNSIVISIKGTSDFGDALADLSIKNVKWSGGYVHQGILLMSQWMFLKVLPLILAYSFKNKIPNIFVTGHSLGAAVASVLTILIQHYKDEIENNGIPLKGYKFNAFTYGCPPSVSKSIIERFEKRLEIEPLSNILEPTFEIFSFVNGRDIVPSLSYASMSDFKDSLYPADLRADKTLEESSWRDTQFSEIYTSTFW
ncbi:hypothetical protein AYI70_g12290 [Smittium culicis]|uniref:sn-1-specific diacylglycerol lipase n=1 Tax=Smittium culicis TaxID=133412 RepID=A0A1R1WY30_9FUNG|nr:hypothetical protein AYI70_g12290 [Smittium culicis]